VLVLLGLTVVIRSSTKSLRPIPWIAVFVKRRLSGESSLASTHAA
jgi:hypothetical protein